MKVYDAIQKKKVNFKTIKENEVSMYVCGPTLYGDIHIGNARPIVFFDIVYRFLKKEYKKVTYASNITDIDDKIINKAEELGISEEELVNQNFKQFKMVLDKLNVLEVDYRPTVVQSIEEIINFIDNLMKEGYAYQGENGDIYFRINKIENYGKVSNRKVEDLISGSRIDIDKYKENSLDFVLWKKTTKGIVWDTPFGKGRPGWHTECVVMINEIFGSKIDIHGGGMDLKFPHHENENAQNCALHHEDIANYWVHNGFVNINDQKMSKSLNNFITVKELLEKYSGNVIRLLLIQTSYQQPINLTEDFIMQTEKLNDRIITFSNTVYVKEYNKYQENDLASEIKVAMEDDFNIPNVISLLIKSMKEKDKLKFSQIVNLLGIKNNYLLEETELTEEIKKLFLEYDKNINEKHYELADELKVELSNKGYDVLRTREGIKIKRNN